MSTKLSLIVTLGVLVAFMLIPSAQATGPCCEPTRCG